MWVEYESVAKLNLFLHVVGRRPNGYHDIESVMVPISLADTLSFDCREKAFGKTQISVFMNPEMGIKEHDNLIFKAATLILKQASTQKAWDIRIRVNKHIPMGAGLGGGSSNAATTLWALNRLCHLNLDVDRLMSLALRLGSDVPFFIQGQPAFVTGQGEVIEPIEVSKSYAIVYQPKQSISTACIFQSETLNRSDPKSDLADIVDHFRKNAHIMWGQNTLEKEVRIRFEAFEQWVRCISVVEPDIKMTGSGSCFFSLYPTKDQAHQKVAEVHQYLDQHPESADFLERVYCVDFKV